MTQEALKLALDFVETVHVGEWVGSIERQLEVITAIKEALANVATEDTSKERVDEMQKQRHEQEPVAWIEKARLDWLTKYGDEADVYTLVTKYKFGYDVPLYITPPQRTWVGLASEDRLTAKYMQDAPDGIEAVIDYIESKLKELNT